MLKVSEILSKPIISLYEAKNVGIISNIFFDKKMQTAKYLVIYSDNDDDINEKFIAFKEISALESDAATVKNLSKIVSRFSIAPTYSINPMNLKVFNHEGKEIGKITDIEIEGNKIINLNLGDKKYPPSMVLSKSDEIIVINDSGQPIKLSPPARIRKTAADKKRNVTITAADKDNTIIATDNLKDINLPYRVLPENTSVATPPAGITKKQGYTFLLEKVMTRTIFSDTGEMIAEKDAAINPEIIEKAISAGKLVHLALHSK